MYVCGDKVCVCVCVHVHACHVPQILTIVYFYYVVL